MNIDSVKSEKVWKILISKKSNYINAQISLLTRFYLNKFYLFTSLIDASH